MSEHVSIEYKKESADTTQAEISDTETTEDEPETERNLIHLQLQNENWWMFPICIITYKEYIWNC